MISKTLPHFATPPATNSRFPYKNHFSSTGLCEFRDFSSLCLNTKTSFSSERPLLLIQGLCGKEEVVAPGADKAWATAHSGGRAGTQPTRPPAGSPHERCGARDRPPPVPSISPSSYPSPPPPPHCHHPHSSRLLLRALEQKTRLSFPLLVSPRIFASWKEVRGHAVLSPVPLLHSFGS